MVHWSSQVFKHFDQRDVGAKSQTPRRSDKNIWQYKVRSRGLPPEDYAKHACTDATTTPIFPMSILTYNRSLRSVITLRSAFYPDGWSAPMAASRRVIVASQMQRTDNQANAQMSAPYLSQFK